VTKLKCFSDLPLTSTHRVNSTSRQSRLVGDCMCGIEGHMALGPATLSCKIQESWSDETACSLRFALVKRYALAKGPLQDLRVSHASNKSHMIDSSHASSSFSCSHLTCKSAQPTLHPPMHYRTFLTNTYPQVHRRAPLALQPQPFRRWSHTQGTEDVGDEVE